MDQPNPTQVQPPAPPAPETPPATPPEAPPATPPEKPPAAPPAPPEDTPPDAGEPGVRESKQVKDEDVDIPDGTDMLDPEQTKKLIAHNVNKGLQPIRDQMEDQRIAQELNDELAAHPEYAPYKDRITKWVNHPNRKGLIKQGLPVTAVIAEAVLPFAQKIGAEKAKKADAEAKKTQNPGQSNRPGEAGAPDYSKMTGKQIEDIAELVKSGRYKP